MTQRFRGINPEAYGIQDIGAREAILALNSEIRRAFEDIEKNKFNGEKVTVTYNGNKERLDDVIKRSVVPIGSIVWMYISWAKALTYRKYGWEICDGDNGTPPLIERQEQASIQRFIRSVKRGYDPWTQDPASPNTGGSVSSSLSAHTITISDHVITPADHSIAIGDHSSHDAHDHSASTITYTPDLPPIEVNTNEPSAYAADGYHVHEILLTTDTSGPYSHSAHAINGASGTASITHTATTVSHNTSGSTLTHSAVSTIPPYVECIPMMKVR